MLLSMSRVMLEQRKFRFLRSECLFNAGKMSLHPKVPPHLKIWTIHIQDDTYFWGNFGKYFKIPQSTVAGIHGPLRFRAK